MNTELCDDVIENIIKIALEQIINEKSLGYGIDISPLANLSCVNKSTTRISNTPA